MYRNIRFRLFVVMAVLLIAAACAKISAPSGGTRDRIPPKVLNSVPLNGTKNFRGKQIDIEFDEYIELDNINEKFMVSPPMKKKPRISKRGKTLRIEFNEELKDSVTYTLYFMDAIKDLNEGNILDNYKFVFSTGPVIDSLSVTGNVYNAFDLEVPEKTIVLLYGNPNDSAVIKTLPDYLSRVDATGYFRIDNIRPGPYRLYALKDDDNSKNYNRVEEPFAFMDSLIRITPEKNFIPVPVDTVPKPVVKTKTPAVTRTTTSALKTPVKPVEPVAKQGDYKMILFEGQKRAHYLAKSPRDLKYKLTYVLSLPPDTMKVSFSIPGAGADKYFIEKTRYQDTITVWLTDSSLYGQTQLKTVLRYPFTDSLGVTGYKQDTIPMRFITPRAPRSGKVARTKLTLTNNISGTLKPGQRIVFESKTPMREPDTTKIKLYEFVEKERFRIPYHFVRDSMISTRLFLNASLKEGKQYFFTADSAAFSNIYNEVSDSIGSKFSVREASSYSRLTLDITNSESQCIIQLLDNTEKLVAQKVIQKDGPVTFSLVDQGQYKLRAIYDVNGDGKWTTGDFYARRQPEPVSYYKEVLEIKEGWDVKQAWDLKLRNFKDAKLRQKAKTK
jgi:hypothetical protein